MQSIMNVSRSNDLVRDYLDKLAATLQSMPSEQIWQVIEVLLQAWRNGKRVYLCGNGGSAATASHMANDLNKYTIQADKPRLRAIALTDNVPLMTAWANDSSYEMIFAEQIINLAEAGDVLIAISASGNSPNILKALETARRCQVVTVGFTGDLGGKMKELVDYCIMIPDSLIGRQEDGHMILDHVISFTLRELIKES